METEIKHGPFSFINDRIRAVNDTPSRQWRMYYGAEELAMHTTSGPNVELSVLFDAFGQDRADFIARTQQAFALPRVDLIDYETGDAVAHFHSHDLCGMQPGIIDDRSRYWICTADRRYSRAVTLTEFAHIVAEHAAPQHAWIIELLPAAVLSRDPTEWCAPTSWELRHIVGEGSFTGISGAKAAELVGVTPQNFRKYTAHDGAATRQKMSFAMWHLLLHKLGVQAA